MKKKLEVHDFPPQYEDEKLRGWNTSVLGIEMPKKDSSILDIGVDEELYESRVYPALWCDDWAIKVLSKRKKGANRVIVMFKGHSFVTNQKEVSIEEYRSLIARMEGAFDGWLDLDHVTICHVDDYRRAMEGVRTK